MPEEMYQRRPLHRAQQVRSRLLGEEGGTCFQVCLCLRLHWPILRDRLPHGALLQVSTNCSTVDVTFPVCCRKAEESQCSDSIHGVVCTRQLCCATIGDPTLPLVVSPTIARCRLGPPVRALPLPPRLSARLPQERSHGQVHGHRRVRGHPRAV